MGDYTVAVIPGGGSAPEAVRAALGALIDWIFTDMPGDEVQRLTFGNVVDLYGIGLPEDVLAGAPA